MNYILKVCNSFPSPSGVSIFSIRKRFNDNKNHFGFRPLPGFLSSQSGLAPLPCGARQVSVPFRGFYLLNASFRLLHNTCVRVSVPFRGFYLLNCMYVCMYVRTSVSVPFRGFYLLNSVDYMIAHVEIVSVPFRGFYLLNKVTAFVNYLEGVSVPFRGFYLLNNKKILGNVRRRVSVPFRGFYLLNAGSGSTIGRISARFRPLPGFLSSQ